MENYGQKTFKEAVTSDLKLNFYKNKNANKSQFVTMPTTRHQHTACRILMHVGSGGKLMM